MFFREPEEKGNGMRIKFAVYGALADTVDVLQSITSSGELSNYMIGMESLEVGMKKHKFIHETHETPTLKGCSLTSR